MREQFYDFNQKALDLLIPWPSHDAKTLADLIRALQSMPEEATQGLDPVIDERPLQANDTAKAPLRERIQRHALIPRGRQPKLGGATRDRVCER